MSIAIGDIRPHVIHPEHSAWPQRYATLIGVVGLHVAAGVALLAIQLGAPSTVAPLVLTVRWVPSKKMPPPQPSPVLKPKEPAQTKPLPAPVQKSIPAPLPRTSPADAPLIQAPATAAASAQAPIAAPAPPAPPQPAPAPQQVVQAAPPIDPDIKPQVDCTQSPVPNYPQASRKLGEEGTVMLRMQVDERGRPLRVEVEKSSSHPRLDRVARETVAESWVCPLRQGKQGFTGWLRVPVSFVLPPL